MARPKRKVWYDVTTFDGFWWSDREQKWVRDLNGSSGSSNAPAKRFEEAKQLAEELCNLGANAIITRWWRHRGKRYCLEFRMNT